MFVYVPVFSKKLDAGKMTSANSAVSVRKMSCTARKSSAARALRTFAVFGSLMNGFSPWMYMPRMSPCSAAWMISTTVSPGWGSSGTPHAASKRPRIAGSFTD